MDLSNEDTKKGWFTAWLAIGKSMKEASDNNESLSIAKIVFRSIKNYNIIQKQTQNQLTDGTNSPTERTDSASL